MIVTPDFPYPPNHGGRVDIWGRIRALHHLGYTIDLAATCKREPTAAETAAAGAYVRKISIRLRSQKISDHLTLRPFQVQSRRALAEMEIPDRYDFLLLESEFVAAILRNPRVKGTPAVLRIHNRETVYFRQLGFAADKWRDKIYHWVEAVKFSLMERSIQGQVRNLMFISCDEMGAYRRKYPTANCVFLPAPVDTASFRQGRRDSRAVLFIGSLFMANNRAAVVWYLREVHPRLLDIPDYRLIIAGNSRGVDLEKIGVAARAHDNVTLIDSPSDLQPLYDESGLFINPMHHGAGVKVKNIEALGRGLPVVTTTVGNQGTGLEPGCEVLVADRPGDFAAAVRMLLNDPERGQELVAAAQRKLAEQYNHERILSEFLSSLPEKGTI